MNLEETRKQAEEAFLFANRLAAKRDVNLRDVDLTAERIMSKYLESIAASLLMIAHQQENLLKELQTTKAAVSSLATRGE